MTLIVIILIALIALVSFYEFRIMRINADLAASNSLLTQYIDYSYDLEVYTDSLKTELRKYAPIVMDYKIAKNQISAHKVATNGNNGSTQNTYALSLPLMPDLPVDTKIEFSPMILNDNGMVIDNGGLLHAVKIAPIADSKPTNGKASSKAIDNSKAIASDKGSFTEPNYSELATAYATNKKYANFVALVNKTHNGKRSTNQINYLLAKFDQWENSKPNSVEEYSKRITADNLAKNK